MQTLTATKTKRLHKFGEFDLLKALAILGLPTVHLLEEGIYDNLATDGVLKLESVIVALCILGPSVFMICMGFGMGGVRSSPHSLVNQGLRFLLLGAVLNILRSVLPAFILWAVKGEPMLKEASFFFASDIYYFVGFSRRRDLLLQA